MSLTPGNLSRSFQPYWADMELCRQAGAIWALLHVTVCLPDICAALESQNGDAAKAKYIAWCERFASHARLTGTERYAMRCKVLHQGRAEAGAAATRYSAFSFGPPAIGRSADHLTLNGTVLNVDVGELASATRRAVNAWIGHLESNPAAPEASCVQRNLPTLVKVQQIQVPLRAEGGTSTTFININRTN